MGSKVHSKNDSSLSCKFLQVMFNKRQKSLLRDSGPFPDDHHIVNQKCICSASIQSLLSPIADSLTLHPPTTSVDRMVLWLLSSFGLVTRENRSPVATFTPQCSLLSVHMSVRLSVCLSVCPAQMQSVWSDDRGVKKTDHKSNLWIQWWWRSCWFVKPQCICLPQQEGRQAGRAGAAVLCPQAPFLFLGPLEPVILWTGAQEKAEWEKGGVGEPRAWRAVSLHRRSKALAPNSAHASTVREDPNLSESVKKTLTQLLIWAKATCHGVVAKSLCVWLLPRSLYQHLRLKITN